jgi:peptide/nickel transport system substrate-binding protein
MLRALAFIPILAPSQTTSTKEIAGPVIGTGPYMIASMDSQMRVLKASPNYRGQAPKPSEVDLEAVPEISSRVAAVQSGDAQIAFDIPSEQVGVVPKVFALPQLEMVNWRLNGLGGLTKDPQVRKALVMGTDLETIRKALLGDKYSTPCDGNYVPPGVFGWDPNAKRPTYDPAGAKQLLQAAGVTGKTITLISSDTATKSIEASQALAQQIGDLGLKVDLQVKDTQSWLNILIRPNPGAIEIVVQGAGAEQWDALPVFLSAPHQGSGLSTFPPEAVPQFEADLTAAEGELDDTKRAADLFDAAKVMRDSNAFICGWTAESVYGTQKNLAWTLRRDNRIDFATIHYA